MEQNYTGISGVQEWFNRAVPQPTAQNLSVQLGCHLEELSEMLDATSTADPLTFRVLGDLQMNLNLASRLFKLGGLQVSVKDRGAFLDAIADQIVTATGVGHMLAMNVDEALSRVNASNWTKFVDGKPVFDANGKVSKGPGYVKVDLTGLF